MSISSPGLRRLPALVLMTVSAENPCLHRDVVANRADKSWLHYQLLIFLLTEVQNSPSDAVNKSSQ